MGFMSSTTKSSQGYSALPPAFQTSIVDAIVGAREFISPWSKAHGGKVMQENIDRFTPMGQTADETRAYEMMRQGFSPNAQTLGADISMLQNPYMESVISEINRQSQGPNSILKQALTESGQFGSNRNILGANDIDLSRQNQIGAFLSDNYNTNLGYALNQLPALRQNDAANLAQIGTAQRSLDFDIRQAPVAALNALAAINNTSGLSTAVGQTAQSKTSGGGFGSVLSAVGGGLSALSGLGGISALGGLGSSVGSGLASVFGNGAGQAVGGFFSGSKMGPYQPFGLSDRETKMNIVSDGEDNGVPMYKFNYKPGFGMSSVVTYRGTMADDAMMINPESVSIDENGVYKVNYDMLGVQMSEVA